MTWRGWTNSEIYVLERLSAEGMTDGEIGKVLHRTEKAVRAKRKFEGITKPVPAKPEPVHEPKILIADIQAAVVREFGIPKAELLSDRQDREASRPRQAGMYLARRLTRHSFQTISLKFNRRDHTTACHAFANIQRLIGADPDLAAKVRAVEAQLA